ncbi:hypothetical protein [Aeromicrobium sp.]|uniref:hypothetical protein n=1 Tax=Aeromicrobium sp. TaxID=1871063 RepID=UPI002FCA403C
MTAPEPDVRYMLTVNDVAEVPVAMAVDINCGDEKTGVTVTLGADAKAVGKVTATDTTLPATVVTEPVPTCVRPFRYRRLSRICSFNWAAVKTAAATHVEGAVHAMVASCESY